MKRCFSSNCAIKFILIFGGCLISKTKSDNSIIASWNWTIRCDVLSPTQAYCARTMAKILFDESVPEIPFGDVDSRVELLEAHVATNGTWLINTHTLFHRFHQLKHLIVMGDAVLPDHVNQSKLREELKNGLFAPLSSLKILSLQFWVRLEIVEGWKFPKGIEEISIKTSNLQQLDLREYPNLKVLDLSGNEYFTKMPPLSSPLPPLRTLRVVNNFYMKFTVHDIVNLCELRWLDYNYCNEDFRLPIDVPQYCECMRLQKYMIALNISGQYEVIGCSFYAGQLKARRIMPDCKNYPVNEFINLHKKKCPITRPTTTTMEPEIEPWRPEPEPEPEPVTPSPIKTTKLPSIVCPPCPGCFLCVIGWFFFLVTLFSSGAAVAIYFVITKRLFFFSNVSRKK